MLYCSPSLHGICPELPQSPEGEGAVLELNRGFRVPKGLCDGPPIWWRPSPPTSPTAHIQQGVGHPKTFLGSEGAPVTVKSPRLGTKWATGETAPRIGQGRETGHASKQVALCGHEPPPGPCMPGGEGLVRGAWSARG